MKAEEELEAAAATVETQRGLLSAAAGLLEKAPRPRSKASTELLHKLYLAGFP